MIFLQIGVVLHEGIRRPFDLRTGSHALKVVQIFFSLLWCYSLPYLYSVQFPGVVNSVLGAPLFGFSEALPTIFTAENGWKSLAKPK